MSAEAEAIGMDETGNPRKVERESREALDRVPETCQSRAGLRGGFEEGDRGRWRVGREHLGP